MVPAQVAQLVEHFLGKEEVTGSIPVLGSSCELIRVVFKLFEEKSDGKRKIRKE